MASANEAKSSPANRQQAARSIGVAKDTAPAAGNATHPEVELRATASAAPFGPSEGNDPASMEPEGVPAPGETILEFENVIKSFSDKKTKQSFEVLKGLNFQVRAKEFVVLMGPSGCGKSTVLKLISGFLKADQGKIWIHSKVKSATVPQAYTCFPWLTAKQNVAFGLALQGKEKKEQEEIAEEYLKKVGLQNYRNFYPRQLSGGMQQRVAIARTLAAKPSILLMDEPFGALDDQTREEMQQMLLELWRQEENTIVFVTHDIAEAMRLAERIFVFGPHPQGLVENFELGGSSSKEIELRTAGDKFQEVKAVLRKHLLRD